MNDHYIVITGNPADGFTHYGPFSDGNEATEWADENLRNVEYWVVRLYDDVQ